MSNIKRIYVEKKPPYASAAKAVLYKIREYLKIETVSNVRVLIRYDMENISESEYEMAKDTVFSEPPLDDVYPSDYIESIKSKPDVSVFFMEYLPGQFDQRADSCVQALELLGAKGPLIKCASGYVIEGKISENELKKIKEILINPVDSREASLEIPDTLVEEYEIPTTVSVMEGFISLSKDELKKLYDSLSLAMTFDDFMFIQSHYFAEEMRNPTITEIRIFDTYWSDHCRHTTFSTHLEDIEFLDGEYKEEIKETFDSYKEYFDKLYNGRSDKHVTLMDVALMAAKVLEKEGYLTDKEESDEINACSIVIPVDVDGKEEEWLLNFKNETHNHPTEIEPFGGAATCLGGAIRDPLSGRTYCYQAMRVTGAADPTVDIDKTIKGKLPQVRIVTEAAAGYSSYGNQIGLATGLVKEIYHPGFAAKRMEIGAVLAAAKRAHVKRLEPAPGDIIILLGGRTGRDGVGGATGSSKAHDINSTLKCGAEVQKGNPPTERKLQRLFRDKEVSLLIKRCNDFGAGGVSVAIGELADGLLIDLDKVPKKYAGLDGTELAISESQERMAVVVDKDDVEKFLQLADRENLEASVVATVTDNRRLIMIWNGNTIADISRDFLDTNGASQTIRVSVDSGKKLDYFSTITGEKADECQKALQDNDIKGAISLALSDLNIASQRGLMERFDSSIGAGTVLYPYGGKYQLSPIQTMVAKIPVGSHKTKTVSFMSYGYDPYLSSLSPYHGAAYAVLSSVSKVVAAGGDYRKIRFSFQEYFKKLGSDPKNWGLPLAALLGAFKMQMDFKLPAIGGKDSMSGSFENMNVPPTLCSFAVSWGLADRVISPEFKEEGNDIFVFKASHDKNDMPVVSDIKKLFDGIYAMITEKKISSAYSIDMGGAISALINMSLGNHIGFKLNDDISIPELFVSDLGSVIAEVPKAFSNDAKALGGILLGETKKDQISVGGNTLSILELIEMSEKRLNPVFPIKDKESREDYKYSLFESAPAYAPNKVAKPRVFIPVFPGTNTEYDLISHFEEAGAIVNAVVFRNNSSSQIEESIGEFEKALNNSQILMFPGGFSAGDEPEGSAKFFSATFRNERLKEAIMDLVNKRDGLVLGICNGFQALIKLGLVPYGDIRLQTGDSPTLTYNTIGRHIARLNYIKVVSNDSPWLNNVKPGEVFATPISHGEGRFVAPKEWIDKLYSTGRVATRYVGPDGDEDNADTNPNGSFAAIEGILSPNGRIYGKMGHVERVGEYVGKNIYGKQDMKIFESGVSYYL